MAHTPLTTVPPKQQETIAGNLHQETSTSAEQTIQGKSAIDTVLSQRQQTHGAFSSNARIIQSMKDLARQGDTYSKLSYGQREAIDMILHKIGRAVNGSPLEIDHYVDMQGYAKLGADATKQHPGFGTSDL